jgi:hypothetical protein
MARPETNEEDLPMVLLRFHPAEGNAPPIEAEISDEAYAILLRYAPTEAEQGVLLSLLIREDREAANARTSSC